MVDRDELSATVRKDIEDLKVGVGEDVSARMATYKTALHSLFTEQNSVMGALRSNRREYDRVKGVVKAASKQGVLSREEAAAALQELDKVKLQLKEYNSMLPRAGSWFLWIFLGSINLYLSENGERLRFKRGYEGFKKNMVQGTMLVVFFLYFWPWRPLLTVFHLTSVYFYTTLTLREAILLINGSKIARWWQMHHYLAIIQTLTLALWPYTDRYKAFMGPFLMYTFYNGVVQLLQHQYQMARLYAKVALGEAQLMETINLESTERLHWSPSMWLLVPFILVGHVWQAYLGYLLLSQIHYHGLLDYHELFAGIYFEILFVGNFVTVMLTLRQKLFQKRQRARLDAQGGRQKKPLTPPIGSPHGTRNAGSSPKRTSIRKRK